MAFRLEPGEVGGERIFFQAEVEDGNHVIRRGAAGDGFKLQRLQVQKPLLQPLRDEELGMGFDEEDVHGC